MPTRLLSRWFSISASQAAFRLLVVVCFCVFAGRAWQHFFWDPPFRAFFWNQGLLEPWVQSLLGMSWEAYASDPGVENAIQNIIGSFGILYAVCALAVIPLGPWRAWKTVLIGAGTFSLFLLSILYGIEKFWRWGEIVEYASQWMAPVLLILLHTRFASHRLLSGLARAAIALTFIGHGLYAIGYYPVPGNFIDMVIINLGVSETTAMKLLLAAGILDFAVAAGMLLPFRWASPFLAYAAAWGLVTALARFGYFYDTTIFSFGAIAFLPEVIYRLPHAGLPIWVLFMGPEKPQDKNRSPS